MQTAKEMWYLEITWCGYVDKNVFKNFHVFGVKEFGSWQVCFKTINFSPFFARRKISNLLHKYKSNIIDFPFAYNWYYFYFPIVKSR